MKKATNNNEETPLVAQEKSSSTSSFLGFLFKLFSSPAAPKNDKNHEDELEQADECFETKQYADALEKYQSILKKNLEDTRQDRTAIGELWYKISECYNALDDKFNAYRAIDEAFRLADDNLDFRAKYWTQQVILESELTEEINAKVDELKTKTIRQFDIFKELTLNQEKTKEDLRKQRVAVEQFIKSLDKLFVLASHLPSVASQDHKSHYLFLKGFFALSLQTYLSREQLNQMVDKCPGFELTRGYQFLHILTRAAENAQTGLVEELWQDKDYQRVLNNDIFPALLERLKKYFEDRFNAYLERSDYRIKISLVR